MKACLIEIFGHNRFSSFVSYASKSPNLNFEMQRRGLAAVTSDQGGQLVITSHQAPTLILYIHHICLRFEHNALVASPSPGQLVIFSFLFHASLLLLPSIFSYPQQLHLHSHQAFKPLKSTTTIITKL